MPDLSAKQIAITHLESLNDNVSMEVISKEILALSGGTTEEKIWKNKFGRFFFAFAFLAAILSFFILISDLQPSQKTPSMLLSLDGFIYGLWLIIPPIWFLVEYVWIFPDELKLKDKHRDDFKFTQEMASKFWGALLVLFGLILYAKYNVNL